MRNETEILIADHASIKSARRRIMELVATYNQDTASGYYELDRLTTNREIGKILVEVMDRGKESKREIKEYMNSL